MYVNMITRPVYKKKEVSTPPNKIKHISPLQRHVFLPLTCRILKRNHIFSPFLSWLTNGTKSYKASPEKHKDDKGWSKGHKESIWMHECNETRCYGWQDNKKMQNIWKTMHARKSRWIERCRDAIEQKPTSMDRPAIEHLLSKQKVSWWIEELLRSNRDCDKKKLKSSIDSLDIEKCREAVQIA